MRIEVKKLDKLRRVIRVNIEGEEFLKERKEIYSQISKNLKVAGFRPGSAPLDVLERYHGKFLREEFLRKILPSSCQKALEDNQLLAASSPRIYDAELTEKKLSFSAELEVKPKIEVKDSDYKGLRIKDVKPEVEELEIEKVLTTIKEVVEKVIKGSIDDQILAKWVGYPTGERLREAIRGNILIEKLTARRQNLDGRISQYLLESIRIDVPEAEVEQCHKGLVSREIYNLRLRGIPEPDIEKYRKDMEEKFRPLALDQVKLAYIIGAIAQKENMEIKDNLGEVVYGFILSQAYYE